MEYLRQTTHQIFKNVYLVTFLSQVVIAGITYAAYVSEIASGILLGLLWFALATLAAFVVAKSAASLAGIPLGAVQDAIMHVSPSTHGVAAPKVETLSIGRAFVTNLAQQVHDIGSIQTDQQDALYKDRVTQATSVLAHIPLPLFVFSKNQQVTFASDAAFGYIGVNSTQLLGNSLYEVVDLEFSSDFTLETWVAECQANKATDTAYWQRVRVRSKTNPELQKQCDIAGSYSRDNSVGVEFVITLFDHTAEYDQDDQSMNFVALAVHELRTPLTIMRGYIEAFQEELTGKMDAATAQYLDRLQASAQHLSSFINNILNVARIQENQLAVKLSEENWANLISRACEDMEIQARSRNKIIVQTIDPNLPTVGVDPITIYEVVCNLLENAIKYSAADADKEINISAHLTNDGLVETSIQDHGVGIPASVLPTLFEKFHRNHRNRSQISGTGLGLYISKAIIEAHDGSIWVNSTEGEGSTFSFTVLPYQSLADSQKRGDNTGMTRAAHGWIKNHSMYRK